MSHIVTYIHTYIYIYICRTSHAPRCSCLKFAKVCGFHPLWLWCVVWTRERGVLGAARGGWKGGFPPGFPIVWRKMSRKVKEKHHQIPSNTINWCFRIFRMSLIFAFFEPLLVIRSPVSCGRWSPQDSHPIHPSAPVHSVGTWCLGRFPEARCVNPAVMVAMFIPIGSIGSMYAVYGNIYHQYTPNVSIYTIHGSYGNLWDIWLTWLIWFKHGHKHGKFSWLTYLC